MEFLKYIVPIYVNDIFWGNGFIVNGMLITANHVVKNKLYTFFDFEEKRYHVDYKKIVVDSYEKRLSNNKVQDLFVCKTDIEDNGLELSSEYDINMPCEFWGYSAENDDMPLSKDYMSNIMIYRNNALDSNYERLDNCFSCKCELKHTNSGGPLFQNGKVIGMIIRCIDHYGKSHKIVFHESVFIKAQSIIKDIQDYG